MRNLEKAICKSELFLGLNKEIEKFVADRGLELNEEQYKALRNVMIVYTIEHDKKVYDVLEKDFYESI